MPPEILVLIFGILFGIGGSILLGQRMQYRHKERLQERADPAAMTELTEAVRDLQEEVRSLQNSSTSFEERLDFTERLLAKPKPAESD
ncbi:MAG: hypothetical protein KAI98_01495 [Gemmatimonadetes bacterium]|nr:hypothetical protein [Gemmatimonadota bacterium]